MPQTQPGNRVVMELEQKLSEDVDGVLRKELEQSLAAIDKRLDGEAKKLQPKTTHKEIAAARQAVQGALVALELVQALHS